MAQAGASSTVIVRLRNWVGDVILGMPAVALLAEHGHAPVLVGKGWAPALLAGYGWPVHARPSSLMQRVRQLRELRDAAAQAEPDWRRRPNALVLPTSFSGALEMRLAGLKAVGYAQEARGPLLHRSQPIVYGGHALISYWSLACAFLGVDRAPPVRIDLPTAPADQQAADALLAAQGIRPGFIAICPFAGGLFEKQEKTWPAFADFTQALLRRTGRDVIACPGPGEESILTQGHAGVRSLNGVKLGVYGGLLRRAALMISNDTGPAHLAAAVGTPVLSVLGPTKPEQWAPWGPQVVVERHWPRWPTVDEVLARSTALLGD